MDHPLSLLVLILAALSLLALISAGEEVNPENSRSSILRQVKDMIPTITGSADVASQSDATIVPDGHNGEVDKSVDVMCNTTALISMLDSCATPERIVSWIKLAKPFMRLMSTVEASRKKNPRNG